MKNYLKDSNNFVYIVLKEGMPIHEVPPRKENLLTKLKLNLFKEYLVPELIEDMHNLFFLVEHYVSLLLMVVFLVELCVISVGG